MLEDQVLYQGKSNLQTLIYNNIQPVSQTGVLALLLTMNN